MPLTEEKNNLSILASDQKSNFPIIDKEADSYFVSYEDSKHMETVVSEYNSDIAAIRKEIMKMWEKSSNKVFLKDVCSAIFKMREQDENILEAIDLYNYMM